MRPTRSATPLTNWCGTHYLASGAQCLRPRTEEEVRSILAAGGDREPVRVLGSRYSWPRLIAAQEGAVLDTSGLSGVTRMDDWMVETGAGTTLAQLHAALRARERRLPHSPPVIAPQTVGGAIATGTHGQGLGQSTVGDVMCSARVVDARGEVVEIDEDHPDFGAFRMHLGSLGVLTRVTFPVVASGVYTCDKRAVSYADFLRHFESWNRSYPFCKAWWFPDHERVHVWLVRAATSREEEAHLANGRRPVVWGERDDGMNEAVDDSVRRMQVDTKTVDTERAQFRTVLRFRDFSNLTGDLLDLLCKGIPVAQINCEIGVPFAAFAKVQQELQRWYTERRPDLHYPIILRATGSSRAWLSPAYGRETCYYGFVVYQAEDGTFADQSFEVLNEIQEILAGFDGLPHWGKYFSPERFSFRAYERWDDFQRVRRRYDPHGRFLSELLGSVFEQ